jgi:Cysteine rich repeat
MIRSLVVIPLVLPLVLMAASVSLATGVSAQGAGPREKDACARDVSRFCRAKMNDGDQVVLACLKQNRARLSKACEKVLIEHGQ